ncbi:unnamed protein product [Brassica oleracea var. botrytis]
MTLSELESNVTKEFFTSTETASLPVLSYWPPNTKELVTGITTPPVIMTNNASLRFFFLHLDAHLGMNLFVTFQAKPVTQPASQVDENPLPFTTPNQPIKHDLNQFRPPSTASSKIPSFSLFGDDDLLHDFPPRHPVDAKSSQPQDTDGVPPAGYDHDFWDPLLEEHLGGSDAVEVMAGIKVPKTAPLPTPSVIHCTTGNGNAFDHTVRLSGEDPTDWKKDLDFLGVHQRERTGGQSSCTLTNTPQPHSSTRTPNPMYHAIERLSLQPPKTRRPSGRPKDKRIPSTGEIQVPKKTKLNRCGRCGVSGHNRTNCKVPI